MYHVEQPAGVEAAPAVKARALCRPRSRTCQRCWPQVALPAPLMPRHVERQSCRLLPHCTGTSATALSIALGKDPRPEEALGITVKAARPGLNAHVARPPDGGVDVLDASAPVWAEEALRVDKGMHLVHQARTSTAQAHRCQFVQSDLGCKPRFNLVPHRALHIAEGDQLVSSPEARDNPIHTDAPSAAHEPVKAALWGAVHGAVHNVPALLLGRSGFLLHVEAPSADESQAMCQDRGAARNCPWSTHPAPKVLSSSCVGDDQGHGSKDSSTEVA